MWLSLGCILNGTHCIYSEHTNTSSHTIELWQPVQEFNSLMVIPAHLWNFFTLINTEWTTGLYKNITTGSKNNYCIHLLYLLWTRIRQHVLVVSVMLNHWTWFLYDGECSLYKTVNTLSQAVVPAHWSCNDKLLYILQVLGKTVSKLCTHASKYHSYFCPLFSETWGQSPQSFVQYSNTCKRFKAITKSRKEFAAQYDVL
jgi:AraC-like DNA-binding protein